MSMTGDLGPSDVRVSVIVPVLNGARTLPAVLRALVSQAGDIGPREILVVDNGSTDGTQDLVRATPGVRLLHAETLGPAAARNVGLKAARGEIVACVDADAQPTRRWLVELLAPFSDPAVVLVAGGMASHPPRTGAQRFVVIHGMGDAERALLPDGRRFANTRNMAVRREAALAVDGWIETLRWAEDVDFSLRILERFGGEVVLQRSAVVLHHDRETDEELATQAIGYGWGTASLCARHPVLYRWGLRERWAVFRRVSGWRVEETHERIATRLGRGDPVRLEYLSYRRRWMGWLRQGFTEARRAGVRPR